MSILDQIRAHVDVGNLHDVPPRDLRDIQDTHSYRRSIFVSSDVAGEMKSRTHEAAFRKLSAQFQAFVMGRTIPVALEPDHKNAEWARLGPPGREVWESRVRGVRPELRLLGRFAAVDVFIVLHLYDSQLKGKKKWDAATSRCQIAWEALFPQAAPIVGRAINDYIAANVTLI